MRQIWLFLILGLPLVAAEGRRLHGNARHVLVPLDQLGAVAEAGGKVVAATRGDVAVVSVPDDFAAASIGPTRKLSRLIEEQPGIQHFLVVFHADVSSADAEQIVNYSGVVRLERPDLITGQMLIQASSEQVQKLAAWDEVSYIYPASQELVSGAAVHGCQGPLTRYGLVAQYVETVGQGWDGSGRGAVDLTYSIGRLTEKLPREQVVEAIELALGKWSQHAQLRFSYVTQTDATRNLNFLFVTGEHGDFHPFDGRGRVLAHTFYPAGVNIEPIAGDLHFDDDEQWQGTTTDLYSVILHELGHALGLGHSDQPAAVMYPYYRRASELHVEDIEALLKLYAAPNQTTAAPSANLLLSVQSPGTTTAGRVTLTGSVLSAGNDVRVSWRVGTIGGVADGTSEWTARDIPLDFGTNSITVTATGGGQSVTKSVSVIRSDEFASTSRDLTVPSVTVASPSTSLSATGATTAKLKGSAKDNVGVVAVKWTTSTGASGNATGTTNWEIASVPLLQGDNIITVRATDAAGNSGKRAITITRR